MSNEISLRAEPPADRLQRLGYGSVRRKPEAGPKELTARHKLLVDYQINGCQHPNILKRIKRPKAVIDEQGVPVIREVSPEPGEPLTLIEAADLLRIRRRNARELATYPIYQRYLEAELKRYREGERIASLQTIVAMRDEPGQGKAADRKVRLQAASMILGEGEGARGTTVNVNLGNTQVTAGIVIMPPPGIEHVASTIEHEANEP